MTRLLKWFFGTMALIFAVLFVGGLFLSGDFNVTRTKVIAAPTDKLYALVVSPRQWKQWSAWNKRDPNMAITYEGPEAGVGAKWIWTSKSEGDGAMTFVNADPPKRLDYELYFPDFKSTSKGAFTFVPQGSNATQVTWTMSGNMGGNPLFRWFALFSDSMVGKDFEEGFEGLEAAAKR